MNVNHDEVNKFNQLAAKWWDPNGPMAPLHVINPVRMQFIRDNLGPKKEQLNLLDVGCGGGILSESLTEFGTVLGIDLAHEALNVAKMHATANNVNVTYEAISIEELAQREEQRFDVITCMEMLEHVPQPPQILQACRSLLAPGGKLFLSTINRNPVSFLGAIVGAEYILNILPRGTHQYKKFITPSELNKYLRSAGFATHKMCGVNYNPFTKQASFSESLMINYFVYAS